MARAWRVWLIASLLSVGCHAGSQSVTAVGAAAQPASSPLTNLPLRRDDGTEAVQRTTAAWTLLFVVVLAAGAYWLVRTQRWTLPARLGTPARDPATTLHRIAQLRLQPQLTLHVIRWGREELLIAATAQQTTLLARRSDAGPGEEKL